MLSIPAVWLLLHSNWSFKYASEEFSPTVLLGICLSLYFGNRFLRSIRCWFILSTRVAISRAWKLNENRTKIVALCGIVAILSGTVLIGVQNIVRIPNCVVTIKEFLLVLGWLKFLNISRMVAFFHFKSYCFKWSLLQTCRYIFAQVYHAGRNDLQLVTSKKYGSSKAFLSNSKRRSKLAL